MNTRAGGGALNADLSGFGLNPRTVTGRALPHWSAGRDGTGRDAPSGDVSGVEVPGVGTERGKVAFCWGSRHGRGRGGKPKETD